MKKTYTPPRATSLAIDAREMLSISGGIGGQGSTTNTEVDASESLTRHTDPHYSPWDNPATATENWSCEK